MYYTEGRDLRFVKGQFKEAATFIARRVHGSRRPLLCIMNGIKWWLCSSGIGRSFCMRLTKTWQHHFMGAMALKVEYCSQMPHSQVTRATGEPHTKVYCCWTVFDFAQVQSSVTADVAYENSQASRRWRLTPGSRSLEMPFPHYLTDRFWSMCCCCSDAIDLLTRWAQPFFKHFSRAVASGLRARSDG